MKQFNFYRARCRVTGPVVEKIAGGSKKELLRGTKVAVISGALGPVLVGPVSAVVELLARHGVSMEAVLSHVFSRRPRGEEVAVDMERFQVAGIEVLSDRLVYLGRKAAAQTIYYVYRGDCKDLNPLCWPTITVTAGITSINTHHWQPAQIGLKDLATLSHHAARKLKELQPLRLK